MEREEIKTLLASMEQQVSTSILGGMEETYAELEKMGFVAYHPDTAHPSVTITQKGIDYLENN